MVGEIELVSAIARPRMCGVDWERFRSEGSLFLDAFLFLLEGSADVGA
jgi:hypothetical protein